MSMRPPGLAIGDALIGWHAPKIASAGITLTSYDWRRNQATDPIYPADPVTTCPRIVLRLLTEDNVALPGQGVDFDFAMSLYYYRLQVPGQQHQRLLIAEVERIKEPLLGRYTPEPVKMAGADYLAPIQTTYHGELRHPRIDDPARRVSVAEIVIVGKSHNRVTA